MAKAVLVVTLPVPPFTAFHMLGGAMKAAEVFPSAQEGWTLRGQETMGLFKMGWPVTVTGTVEEDGHGGSVIRLHGQNFGYAFNRIHAENVLRRIGETLQRAAAAMPPVSAAPPVVSSSTSDPSLPPRIS